MEYQKQLLKRLLQMIEKNEKEKLYYNSALKKLPQFDTVFNDRTLWYREFDKLNKDEQRAWYNNGNRYSVSAIKRIRIELNKSMIEWEKGE